MDTCSPSYHTGDLQTRIFHSPTMKLKLGTNAHFSKMSETNGLGIFAPTDIWPFKCEPDFSSAMIGHFCYLSAHWINDWQVQHSSPVRCGQGLLCLYLGLCTRHPLAFCSLEYQNQPSVLQCKGGQPIRKAEHPLTFLPLIHKVGSFTKWAPGTTSTSHIQWFCCQHLCRKHFHHKHFHHLTGHWQFCHRRENNFLIIQFYFSINKSTTFSWLNIFKLVVNFISFLHWQSSHSIPIF